MSNLKDIGFMYVYSSYFILKIYALLALLMFFLPSASKLLGFYIISVL